MTLRMEICSIFETIYDVKILVLQQRWHCVFSKCQTKPSLEGERSCLIYLLCLYPTCIYVCCLGQSLHIVGVPTFIEQSRVLALRASRRKATFVRKSFFLFPSTPVSTPLHQREGSAVEIGLAVLQGVKEILLSAKAAKGLCALIQHYTLFSGNIKNKGF